MRKLIWCAAAGAVAAGSAWATVYAWNHQGALARGSLGSTCVVSLVNKAHVATPTTPASPSGEASAPLWTNIPSGRPTEVQPEHELKLSMPIVIREPDDVAGTGGTEEGKALDTLNHGYEEERQAILEQLRPLMSDIVNAEIVAGSTKASDDTVCPQPMPYCVDEEEDIKVTDPAPVMPYAKEEPAPKAAVMAVGELLLTVPFLGDIEPEPDLVEVLPYPLHDCEDKPAVVDTAPSPEYLKAIELAVAMMKESASPSWHLWGCTFDATPEIPDGTEEAEPKSPEEESYHYHDHDLSCPYSGCPYPGNYQRMPERPVEESEPKKAGEKPAEPEKSAAVGAVAGEASKTTPDNALENQIGVLVSRGGDGSSVRHGIEAFVPAVGAWIDAHQKAQEERLQAKAVQDAVLSVAETVALAVAESNVLGCGDMSLSTLVHRAKEVLSDYVHMLNDERGAYCEDPVVLAPDRPETKEPAKATSDTLEFRLSDYAPYEDDNDTGPF